MKNEKSHLSSRRYNKILSRSEIVLIQTLSRILLALLLAAEVAQIGHDLLYASDPLPGFLRTVRQQVEVFLAALEDNGEASLFKAGLDVFIEPLRLAAQSQRIDLINGDCLERGGVLSELLPLQAGYSWD